MKTKYSISLLIFALFELSQILAQSPVTIYTPKGSSVYTHSRPEEMDQEDKENASEWVETYYPQATEINPHSATTTYNCHGYAWHVSEGGSIVPISYFYGDTYESIYWTDYSYIETTEANASKISYTSDNHSAIQTSTQGIYISKWGDFPLMQHARNYGPYVMSSRKYYRLNPGINGAVDPPLCVGQERTFTSNTSISGSTYSWTRDNNLLDYVSGSGTTSYRVKAKSGDGNAWVRLQITTPSGEVATTDYKYFWVGKKSYDVIGPGTYPYEGCTNTQYSFSVSPFINTSRDTLTWSIIPSSGYIYPYYTNYAAITFYYPHAGYRVIANINSICGTSHAETSIYIDECFDFLISPNPATDIITINRVAVCEATDGKIMMKSPDAVNATYDIQIVDYYGSIHLQATKSGDSFTLPVSNLKDGTYFVKISNGKKVFNLKLVVKH